MIIIGIIIGFAMGAAAAVVAMRKSPQLPVENIVKKRPKRARQPEDAEAKRLQQLLLNIDNYDGTGRGQVKIG